ncbi:MAG TPA: hypothetical protein VNJ31_11445, partial [Methyloceanibacter sp.]|nr:hypothetical protein [Methyloceanibacter sp.]
MFLVAQHFLRVILGLSLIVFAVACVMDRSSAADIAGSGDHPLVGRYEGAEIVGYAVADYDEAIILDGPMDPGGAERSGPGFKTIEGRVFLI